MNKDKRVLKAFEVVSPKANLKVIKQIEVENQHYTIAEVKWKEETAIGIRWNCTENERKNKNQKDKFIGTPNSRGYPTWFILPNDFLKDLMNEESDFRKNEFIKTLK